MGDMVTIGIFPFKPSVGFDRGISLDTKMTVKVPHLAARSISLSTGVHILCAGTPACSQPEFIEFEDDAIITFRSEFDRLMPWNMFHSFSGAFSGWAQAADFLDRTEAAFCLGQEFELDIDEQVMQLWSVKHSLMPLKCPIHWSTPWPSQRHVGLHGSVADWTLANVIRVQTNLCLSMSPPCQSWSKGGKHLGLADLNGWSFVDAIQLAMVLQPDEIVEHDHFRLVEMLFQILGCKKVWMQVTPLHNMSHHCRTRWLAAWCRFDTDAQFVGFTFPLRHSPRCPWDDPSNHLSVPQVWRPQLILTASECAIYNDPNFLPRSGKTKNVNECSAANRTLWERVPATDQPLPTLCASYTTQHLLSNRHIQLRGLFTFLRKTAAGFEFFDPGQFCTLFGTQSHIVLPTKVPEAFRIVGNAIAIPHAVLSLGVVMHAVGQMSIDPLHLVRKSWVTRCQAHNSVMFEHRGYVHMIRASDAHEWISVECKMHQSQEHAFCCEGNLQAVDFCLFATAEMLAFDFMLQHFHGPHELVKQVYFRAIDAKSSMTMPVGLLAMQEQDWELVLASVCIGRCKFTRLDSTKVIEISPTMPFEAEQIVHINHPPEFDLIAHSKWFRTVSDLCKDLRMDSGNQAASLVILQADIGFHFQCWGTMDEIQKTARWIQSQIGGKIFPSCGFHTGGNHCTHLVIPSDMQDKRVVYLADAGTFHLVQIDFACPNSIIFKHADQILEASDPITVHTWPMDQVISLTAKTLTHAGGHQEANGPPPRLAQGANFNQRAEFMCNTNGWLATDEMMAMTQTIQWSQRTHHFAAPVLWDPSKPDFEDDGTEIHIFNNSITVIPILLRAHWAACEVHRHGDRAEVVMLQMPQDCISRATHIIARLLDIAPHRIEVRHELTGYVPHLCGWTLLQRWFEDLQLLDEITDVSRQYPLPDSYVQTIEMCLQCSIEDWTSNGMPHRLGYLAVRLRKNFLWFLARRHSIGQPVQQPALVVGIPEPPHRAIIQMPPAQQSLSERITARLQVYHQHPGWAVSDELDYTLETLRLYEPHTLFCPPAEWDHQSGQLRFLNGLHPVYESHRHVVWFIASQNHWITVELCVYDAFSQLILTIPPVWRHLVHQMIGFLIRTANIDQNGLQIHYMEQRDPDGMCGFANLFRLFRRLNMAVGPLGDPQIRMLLTHDAADDIQQVRNEANLEWIRANIPAEFLDFTINVRNWFLLRILEGRFPLPTVAAGTTQTDQDMPDARAKPSKAEVAAKQASSTAKADPWLTADPWTKKQARPVQSKWEDLVIQEPLPFINKDDVALTQTHRLQLGPSRGGIVLSTKAHLAEISKIVGSADLAILIPATDAGALPHITKRLEGPFEVSLNDTKAQTAYKRLVHMIVLSGSVRFQLPKAKIKVKTPSIAEIVLEIDSRLVTKADFDRLKDSPIASFRHLVQQVAPQIDTSFVLYGYRLSNHPGAAKQESQMQCVLKAPLLCRKALLEASGTTELLVRDYMEKGKSTDDTTILPRFWPASQQELQRMRIAVHGTPGLAGIVVTRRGLAVRVWTDSIKEARSALLAGDPRLVAENLHVIPRYTVELSG